MEYCGTLSHKREGQNSVAVDSDLFPGMKLVQRLSVDIIESYVIEK